MVQANPIVPGIEDLILSEKRHHRQTEPDVGRRQLLIQ